MYDYEKQTWSDNFFSKVQIGMKVTVSAGYAPSKKKVFFGFVQDMSVEYSSDSAPRLNVTAMDGLALMTNNKEAQDFGEKTTSDVVDELVASCKKEGVIESYTIGKLPTFKGKFVKSKMMSDYDFLRRVAEMCFMSFCVIDGELIFDNMMKNTKSLITLDLGVSLMSFRKGMSVGSTVTGSVTVTSNGDTTEKKELRGTADTPSAYDKGDTVKEKWKALKGTSRDIQMNFLQTADECKTVAQNMLDSLCLGFVTGSGRCIGIPEIIPGRYITVKGMDDETNGDYYITDVTHNFSSQGFFTTFEVKGIRC